MAALASDWLRHFRLLLWNCWTEFKETWQEARSQRPLPSLCFSGRSVNKNVRLGRFLKKVAYFTQVHDMWPFGPLVFLLSPLIAVRKPKFYFRNYYRNVFQSDDHNLTSRNFRSYGLTIWSAFPFYLQQDSWRKLVWDKILIFIRNAWSVVGEYNICTTTDLDLTFCVSSVCT